MKTATITLQLPKQDLEFAEQYARKHRMTVHTLIDQLLQSLRSREESRRESNSGETDAWQELFRIGNALEADDAPESQTLTAAVLTMRR